VAARGGGFAALGRNGCPGLGFERGLAWEQSRATGNVSRGSVRGAEDRRAADVGIAQLGGNGERFRTQEGERERAKGLERILTTTRTFGAMKSSKGSGGTAVQCGARSSAMVARLGLGFEAKAARA
jgi:hypothetical protein